MATISHCPTCGRELNIPDELLGRSVKCAECGTTFIAGSQGQATPMFPAAGFLQGVGMPVGDSAGLVGRSLVVGPAVALIVLSTINLLLGLIMIIGGNMLRDRPEPEIIQIHKDLVHEIDLQMQAGNPPLINIPGEFKEFRPMYDAFMRGLVLFGTVYGVVAFMAIFAASRMLHLRWLGFTRLMAVLLMIPLTAPLWWLGILIGIWTLITLSRAEVKNAVV